MKNINPYTSYKPSGIAWLGDIPQHWEVRKLKFVADCFPSNVDKHSKQDEKPVRLCNYTDVYKNDYIKNAMRFMIATASDDQIEKFALKKDDVIITKDSETSNDIAVPALVNEDLDNVICGYHLSVLRPNKNLNGSFLFRMLLCKPINIQFEVCANGVTRVGLGVYDLKKAKIPVPSLEEQTAIAHFLDYKLYKIDRFIRKKKQLIALLNEQKAAIINDAVTKGLDPSVKMKDSGIEWLGNVPEHWEVRKLKGLIKVLTDYTANGSFADLAKNVSYKDEVDYARLIRLTDLRVKFNNNGVYIDEQSYNYLSKSSLNGGEILMANVGAYSGHSFIVPENLAFKASLAPNMFLIKFREDLVSKKYIFYALNAKYLLSQIVLKATATAQPKLNKFNVKENFVFLPPSLEEQKAIVTHIEQETATLNRTIATIEKEIALVQEYRTTLIAEAVTGKIDVRGYELGTEDWGLEEDLEAEMGEDTEGGEEE